MKFLLLIGLVLLVSCKKDSGYGYGLEDEYLKAVKTELVDSLLVQDYKSLDFDKSTKTNYKTGETFLRIGILGKDVSSEFLLLKTDNEGHILEGLIVELQKNQYDSGKEFQYNGSVTIHGLRRNLRLQAEIVSGYITNRPSERLRRSYVVPSVNLPTVVVTCYIPGSGPRLTSDWINLLHLFGSYPNSPALYNSLSGTNTGSYSYANNGGSGGSGVGSGGDGVATNGTNYNSNSNPGSGSVYYEDPIEIDFERVEGLTAIELEKYLKCFSKISDNGASCSIEIFSDIPVDNDPNKLFDWRTGSPGHTFIQIKKTNGSQAVMQNIGFYPVDGWKTTLTPAPIKGMFVDNGKHEFNAGLLMKITPEELKKILVHIEYLARFIKYDIDEYNCTDFALEVFNRVRVSNPLEIPKYPIPNGMAPNGTSTPQGLYKTLKSMLQNGVESANINIPGVKGWVSESDGPCE